MLTKHKLKMIYTRIRGKSMKKDKLINKIIYRLSYSGRRERNLKETSDNISKYMNMSDDEFIMEYTEVCSRYEHKKLILTVISIGLIISMISNIWKYFYEFLMKNIYLQKYCCSRCEKPSYCFIINYHINDFFSCSIYYI